MRIINLVKRVFPKWNSSNGSGDVNGKARPFDVVPLEYQWINNEQLLREEGAVYGMLGQGMEDKLNVIQKYFQKIVAALEVQINAVEKTLIVLSDKRLEVQDKLEKAEEQLEKYPEKPVDQEHHFWRSLAGFIIYTVITSSAFYLTFLWLLPEFGGNTVLVSLGVFLFGAVSLFGHFPILLSNDEVINKGNKRENWKLILEELGIPVIVTLVIVIFGGSHHPWLHSLALALFLLFVFLFAGKGLLASITAIGPQWQIYRTNIHQNKRYRTGLKDIKSKIEVNTTALDNIEQSIEEKQKELSNLNKELAGTQEECETRKAYFVSEFTLAENTHLRHDLFD